MAGALACKACHGVWVSEPEIERRLRERCRTDPGALVFADGPGPVLPCPVCWDPMAPRSLEGVPVDRCGRHGVWFDADELERTLRAAQARLPPPRVLTADAQRGAAAPAASRRPAAPPPRPAPRDDDSADSRGSAWDVIEVLAEIAHAVARAMD